MEAENTTFPLLLDDVIFTKDIENRIVNIFTGTGEKDATKAKAYKVRCGMLMASNFTVGDLQRLDFVKLFFILLLANLCRDVIFRYLVFIISVTAKQL